MKTFNQEEIEQMLAQQPRRLASASPGTASPGWDIFDSDTLSSITFTTSSHTTPTKP